MSEAGGGGTSERWSPQRRDAEGNLGRAEAEQARSVSRDEVGCVLPGHRLGNKAAEKALLNPTAWLPGEQFKSPRERLIF